MEDRLVMLVLGILLSGSENKTAVAGKVRGARNVPSSAVENTAKITAPWIPETSAAVSASTTAFWGLNIM